MSNNKETKVLRVGAGTSSKELAKSIAATYTNEKKEKVVLRAVGASAVNQMMKGWILAFGILSQKGVNMETTGRFCDIPSNREGEEEKMVTATEMLIRFTHE